MRRILAMFVVLWFLLVPLRPAAADPGPVTSAVAEAAPTVRVSGGDRAATAVALSRHGWDSADSVVLVRADDPADALTAGMLADHLGAPMLLTSGAVLSRGVSEEIARLGAARVVVVGGPAAVGTAVVDALVEDGRAVERIAGSDRFATAVAVSIEITAHPDEFLVALGAHADPDRTWPDAIAAGAATVLEGTSPLLLTEPERLPTVTRERLAEAPAWVALVGGTDAISDDIAAELQEIVPTVTRFGGEDRYATSRRILDVVLDGVSEAPAPLVVTSGGDFPDALAAAALAARIGGFLLLIPPTGMDPEGEHVAWLESNRRRFSSVVAVGGTAALTDDAVRQVADAVERPLPPPVDGELVLPHMSEMGPRWDEAFVIGYGDDPGLLGTSPYGEEPNLFAGPEYGAQAPDGTWWFLDTAKRRVAHYDAEGRYLGEVVVPPDLLADGEFFPYQLPRVLADGTLVAVWVSLDAATTTILRIHDGQVDGVVVDGVAVIRADDGERLYGVDADGELIRVDLIDASVTPVPAFVAPDGSSWRVGVDSAVLSFARPDVGQARSLALLASEPPGGPLVTSTVEFAPSADGSIHLLLSGIAADETTTVGGFTTIAPDGSVAPVETVRPLESTAATGTPAHLGVRPGTDEVTLTLVEPDGVHVYRRIP